MVSAVCTTIEDQQATIRPHRPAEKNVFDDEMIQELRTALHDAERNEDVRWVVLTGAGDSFCAGGDIDRMAVRLEGDISSANVRRDIIDETRDTVERLFHLEKPVIARVEGAAVGAGANIALAADLVFAAEYTIFCETFKYVGMGVDFSGSFLLPQLVGLHQAKELVFSGETISGAEAAEMGLINDAVPEEELDDLVDDWADTIASGPTESLVLLKQALNRGASTDFSAALHFESLVQGVLSDTDDHREGVAAFREGHDLEFNGE